VKDLSRKNGQDRVLQMLDTLESTPGIGLYEIANIVEGGRKTLEGL
jgi:hypothetical protein